jgi:hypothetical protein
MSNTPFAHFTEDITRARKLLDHANSLERARRSSRLYNDVRLSSVALAVGALDAYLCDKYSDSLACVLQAYVKKKWNGKLPAQYAKRELPAGEVLSTARKARPLWSIRMASRKIMEKDNMLSISRLDDYFNGNLPAGGKIWLDFIPIVIAYNRRRLTKCTSSDLTGLSPSQLTSKKKEAIAALKERIGCIIQRRHDWIHNCGRPKNAIQDLNHSAARDMVEDVETLARELDSYIEANRLAR